MDPNINRLPPFSSSTRGQPLSSSTRGEYDIPPQEDLIGKTISLELFEYILSFLDEMAQRQSSQVSTIWKAATIDTARREESSKIKNFIEFIINNLGQRKYQPEIEKLKDIIQGGMGGILQKITLLEVKNSMHQVYYQILDVLKRLEEKDLATLEEKSKNIELPILFKDIFKISKVYKTLDGTKTILEGEDEEEERLITIGKACVELAELGQVDEAIEIANTILPTDLEEDPKTITFRDICMILALKNQVAKAIEIVKATGDERIIKSAMANTCSTLVIEGKYDQAAEIARTFFDENTARQLLRAFLLTRAELRLPPLNLTDQEWNYLNLPDEELKYLKG